MHEYLDAIGRVLAVIRDALLIVLMLLVLYFGLRFVIAIAEATEKSNPPAAECWIVPDVVKC